MGYILTFIGFIFICFICGWYTLGTILIIFAILIIAVIIISSKSAVDNQKENMEKRKIRDLKISQINAEQKELTEKKYGRSIIERDSFSNGNSFSVHEESKVVLINKSAMPYSNIRACELLVDGQTSTSTTSTITKSSTGSVVGRAVVGTVVAGGAGAVIGGLSGKKTGTGETTTNVITNYSVRISTNNIAEPTKIIRCNNDIVFATNLVDTLNIIIERPDKNEPPTKIVNLEKINGSNEQNSVADLKLLSEKLSKFQEVDRLNEFSN